MYKYVITCSVIKIMKPIFMVDIKWQKKIFI